MDETLDWKQKISLDCLHLIAELTFLSNNLLYKEFNFINLPFHLIKPFAKLLSTAVKIGKENILNECEREKEKELVSYCANFYQKNHLF